MLWAYTLLSAHPITIPSFYLALWQVYYLAVRGMETQDLVAPISKIVPWHVPFGFMYAIVLFIYRDNCINDLSFQKLFRYVSSHVSTVPHIINLPQWTIQQLALWG